MSDEYIRKADAVDAVEFGITLASAINIETGERTELFQRENDELREAVKRIKDIEPADVAPVVHGRWEHLYLPMSIMPHKCSICGCPAPWHMKGRDLEEYLTNYCPNCGAKMDAQREE